jgi:hypothetical protein
LITVIVVGQNANNQDATQADAASWRDNYGQTGVVVADPGWNTGPTWYPFGVDAGGGQWSIGLPGLGLLAPGMEVVTIGNPTAAQIEGALPG